MGSGRMAIRPYRGLVLSAEGFAAAAGLVGVGVGELEATAD